MNAIFMCKCHADVHKHEKLNSERPYIVFIDSTFMGDSNKYIISYSLWPCTRLSEKPSGPLLCLINQTPSAIGI